MNKQVHILGAGINGLCTAWYLNNMGYEVTIIDKSDLKDGTSFGNAGMIVPSHFIPLASPGVISKGLKWMFNSKSPFYVRPKLDLDLLQWMYKFYKSCTNEHVRNFSEILFNFNKWSKELYHELSELNEFNFSFMEEGLLMLYNTKKQEEEELHVAEMASDLGIKVKKLSNSEINELENISVSALGGVLFPEDAHLYPNYFMRDMVSALKTRGVNFHINQNIKLVNSYKDRVTAIETSNKKIDVSCLVVTGGAWTASILKSLGVKIWLQPGKGYSITQYNLNEKPKYPTILTEAKVAVTPMGPDLRIGGTLELGNWDNSINKNRLAGITESISKYYTDLNLPEHNEVWVGYRPCSTDGLPLIGKVPSYSNVFVGTGHGMMGMSMGPATGKLLANLIAYSNNEFKYEEAFRVDR